MGIPALKTTQADLSKSVALSTNLTTTLLRITLPTSASHTATIFSLTGQALGTYLLSLSTNTISVENLTLGLYLLRLSDATTGLVTSTARFMKQ